MGLSAYLLELSGAPAGETEMDPESVKLIIIEGPFAGKKDR